MKTERKVFPKRIVNGILLLDKPTGMTSNAALQQVKRLFQAKKAGHTGSLDPLASGLLPLCFGEATKFSQYLLMADKSYVVQAKLGIRTASGDSEGDNIAERLVPALTTIQLESVLEKFRGDIEQIPSMFSALKHQGQPLYKLARQGIEIDRKSRPVKIFTLELRRFETDFLELFVHCSKGTYIRTLIDDLGEALGCGAHVTALRRVAVGHYQENQMTTMEQLAAAKNDLMILDQHLLTIEGMMNQFPVIKTTSLITLYFSQGQAVMIPNAPTQGFVKLFSDRNEFVGIGEVQDDGKIAPRRLVKREKNAVL